MRRGRLLVATTVHQADDARISAKLIGTLVSEWDITYATRVPGPSGLTGVAWLPLPGSRWRRWWRVGRLMMQRQWDLVAFHDPELLPVGILRAVLGRPTLFDLHENLPAQIRTKSWVPAPLRPLLAGLFSGLLRLGERRMVITLAEDGYQPLFSAPHPVFANFPLVAEAPEPAAAADPPFLVYLGDITELRGAYLALETALGAECRLVMIGRVAPPDLATALQERAAILGVDLELTGPMPHREALVAIAPALGGLAPLLDVPNYRNSLPTKVLDYLAMGLPVLASDLPGTRRVVGERPALEYVRPGDPGEWRRAGADLAADPARRQEARAGVGEIRASFSWPADDVLRVYAEAGRR